MNELTASFDSLPLEYQRVIQVAQEQLQITIRPLQELVGGWSGAAIYLVSVASAGSGRVEHLVLKVDHKRPQSKSDEVTRHQAARRLSPPEFARRHLPEIRYDRVEDENALAILYAIAGQSLHNFRPLSKYRQQSRLETLFSATNRYLLDEWNQEPAFEPVDHPQALLQKWLGFRLNPGQNLEGFLRDECRINPDQAGFIIQDDVLPNPLYYARHREPWGAVRPGDAMVGLQHSDLNANNILASFSGEGAELEGYYLIDFALFKENMPLLYDQRYLEMSFLVHAMLQGSFAGLMDLITRLADHEILEAQEAPTAMAGANAAIMAGRLAFANWVRVGHPSLHDDLWGQYWLAGAAAGLSYCHKAGQPVEIRMAGLIYAAANLKQYFRLFGVAMPVEATQLFSECLVGDRIRAGGTLVKSAAKPAHNLPSPLTEFVGRQVELEAITDLLFRAETRLVTLTGPGGTGKTRLGLEFGWAVLERFRHGVFFIDLAPISDPALFAAKTAHAVGIREGGGRPPLEVLTDFLANREMLLLFDNFEQVIEAATDLGALLSAAPRVKALATSRIPLHLRGEHEFPVDPLDIPAAGDLSLVEILQYEALALFRQQAQSVKPSFEIIEQNRAAVVEICRRLDGLPLAIEIAAARIKMLPVQALLKRLDQSLQLLVGGPKDLPGRQQTLRRTIDWSYDLLAPNERTLFARLGVFAGGFTLESAEEVCNGSAEVDVFAGIEALVNGSLLRQVNSVTDEPRFDMLRTIREYALEKAEQAGELADLQQAHCNYFTRLAQGADDGGVMGLNSVTWLKRFEEEQANLRTALSWALADDEGIPLVIGMVLQLAWFWYRHGHLREGSAWMDRVVEVTAGLGQSPLRALALVGKGYLAMWSGDLLVAEAHGREAVEMCQRLGFDDGLGMAKLGYGTTLINRGKDKEAYPHLVDAVELFDQQQAWAKGAAMVHLANVSLGLGQSDQAVKWLNLAMPVMVATGDPWNIAFAYSNYGEVARTQGDYEKAENYYRQTETYYTKADARGDQARLVNVFGYLAQHKGNYDEANALFQQGLDDFRELGNHRGIAESLAGLAGLAAEQGEYEWAAPLLSAAESQLIALGGAWWPADRVEVELARARLQSVLKDEFEGFWARGQAMGVEQAIAYASGGG
jgi:predicted ATPase